MIAPGQTIAFKLFAIAPAVSGEFLLRVTLVQEDARWFDQSDSPTVQDFPVSVVP